MEVREVSREGWLALRGLVRRTHPDGEVEGETEGAEIGGRKGESFCRDQVLEVRNRAHEDGEAGKARKRE